MEDNKVVQLSDFKKKKNKNHVIEKNDKLDLLNHELLSQIGFSTRDFRFFESAIYEDPGFAEILTDLMDFRGKTIGKLKEAIKYVRLN
jgi:hypothetical protein